MSMKTQGPDWNFWGIVVTCVIFALGVLGAFARTLWRWADKKWIGIPRNQLKRIYLSAIEPAIKGIPGISIETRKALKSAASRAIRDPQFFDQFIMPRYVDVAMESHALSERIEAALPQAGEELIPAFTMGFYKAVEQATEGHSIFGERHEDVREFLQSFGKPQMPDRIPAGFTTYLEDMEVLVIKRALENGDWSGIFGKNPSYDDFRNLERPEFQKKLREVLLWFRDRYSERIARQGFGCIYFLAHYWWDCYLDTRQRESPLINTWKDIEKSGEGRTFIEKLEVFQREYPCVREYRNRDRQTKRWNLVGEALTEIRRLLFVRDEDDRAAPSQRYLRAITNIYLAEVYRYAPSAEGYTGPDHPRLWELYREAAEQFEHIGNTFNLYWTHYEAAAACLEAGLFCKRQNRPSPAAERFAQAETEAALALRGAACLRAEEDRESGIDRELIGNALRVLADIRWEDEKTRDTAWGFYCAALLAAYAFLESEGDEYAQEFYGEQADRLADRLKALPRSTETERLRALKVCEFLRGFWGVYWKLRKAATPDAKSILRSLGSSAPEQRLVPPRPRLEDIRKPQTEAEPVPEYRQQVRAVLAAMPEALAEVSDISLPALLGAVARNLQ
jgi:hypothetical protein